MKKHAEQISRSATSIASRSAFAKADSRSFKPSPSAAAPGALAHRLGEIAITSPTLKQAPVIQARSAERAAQKTADIGVANAAPRSNDTGLPDRLKAGIEQLSGFDMSAVRVHFNSSRPAQLQALAYAQGTHIYVSPGRQRSLPHEAWHVVQQAQGRVPPMRRISPGVPVNDSEGLEHEASVMGARALTNAADVQHAPQKHDDVETISSSAGEVVQRDIGFEFESRDISTRKGNNGAVPANLFANKKTANDTFNRGASTRIAKGAQILTKPDIEIQADDGAAQGLSDLEVVTTHFPLDDNGRARLVQAMTDLDALVLAHHNLPAGYFGIIPAMALDGVAGFATDLTDAMMLGKWSTAKTAPQVTMGMRLRNIANIVKELHGAPGETGGEKQARDPGRIRMRGASTQIQNEPRALAGEAQLLVDAHTLATATLQAYRQNNQAAPGGPSLEGLLTIIFSYCESMPQKFSFLKQFTPLMAKTDLATTFTKLPAQVRTYYSQQTNGHSNLRDLVASAANYNAKMGQPLFEGVHGLQEDAILGEQVSWYHGLNLGDWLDGIVLRKDWLHQRTKAGVDRLTNRKFPNRPINRQVEGYGALGKRMDKDEGTREKLPVFELRSATNMITYNAAHQWALDFFDYVRSLNENPGGGHQLMV